MTVLWPPCWCDCPVKAPIHFWLSCAIRSVATGNQCSRPMKSFPIATDQITRLSRKVNWGLKTQMLAATLWGTASLCHNFYKILFTVTEKCTPGTVSVNSRVLICILTDPNRQQVSKTSSPLTLGARTGMRHLAYYHHFITTTTAYYITTSTTVESLMKDHSDERLPLLEDHFFPKPFPSWFNITVSLTKDRPSPLTTLVWLLGWS